MHVTGAIGWSETSAGASNPTSGRWRLPSPARAIPSSFDSIAPLDHALLQRCLEVEDADAGPVSGRIGIPEGERSWEFTPLEEWRDSGYVLVVDTMLEDLAGNSVARVFDRDLSDPDHTPIAARSVTLDFHPT